MIPNASTMEARVAERKVAHALLSGAMLILILSGTYCPAQSLTSMTGLLNIPSAEMNPDGTLIFGCHYLDRHFIVYGSGRFDCLAWYATITFLPCLEISLRSTRLLHSASIGRHTVDRMPSLRLRLLKEGSILPSIVIGAHDFATGARETGVNQSFGAAYLAASRHISFRGNNLGLTLGRGEARFRHNQFVGWFGGIDFSRRILVPVHLIAEYDADNINVGLKLFLFNHLQLLGLWQGLEEFSGGIYWHLYLRE